MQGRLPLVFLKRAQVEHIITNSPPSASTSEKLIKPVLEIGTGRS